LKDSAVKWAIANIDSILKISVANTSELKLASNRDRATYRSTVQSQELAAMT
jgi:hypothetical protein